MRKNRNIFAIFLSVVLFVGMFAGIGFEIEAEASTGVTTIYFDNSVCGWSEVYAYVWGEDISAALISGTKAADTYEFSIPEQYTKILFKNTSGINSWDKQTADTDMPAVSGYIFIPDSALNQTGGSWRIYSDNVEKPANEAKYFNNSRTGWSEVYAYVWGDDISAEVIAGTKVSENIYKFNIPSQYTKILFKNTPGTNIWDRQTADTYIPAEMQNAYMPNSGDNKTDGFWYVYLDDTEELTANWSYAISGNTICLNDYIGTDTEVTVNDYYYINNVKYKTEFPSSAGYRGPFIGNQDITKVTFNGTGMLTDNSVPYLFYQCRALTTVVGFGGNFTNMNNTFRYCSVLDCPITIPASVTSAEYAFYECYKLSTMPGLPSDSQLQTANSMFYFCMELQADSISLPENLTSMNTMFYYCKKLNAADIIIPDSVTEASYAFGTCESLRVLPVIRKTSGLKKTTGMFSGCINAVSGNLYLPVTVTEASYMFNNCSMLGHYTGTGFYLHSYIDATTAGMTGIFNKVGYYVHTGAAGAYGYKDCIVYVENASSTTDAQYTAMAAYVNPSYMTIQLGSERN